MTGSGRSALGNWMRALRKGRKVSQAEAAGEIGISRTHLSNLETGRHHPGRDTLMAIASYYQESLDWLVAPARHLNEQSEATTAQPENLLELAVGFLGQEPGLGPARYARRVALIHKALQEAHRDGKTVTAETVPGIVADALDQAPDDSR